MVTSTHLITYEESLLMPESNLEEVIDGELHTMPPATKNHGSLVRWLQRIFDRQMSETLDLVQGTGFLFQREPLRYRIPDLAIVDRAAWKSDLRATSDPYSHIVPELVIEIVSPANRKGALQRLLQNYADFGIPEVLLFHPETRTYQSYRGLSLADTAQTGIVSPKTMPEVSIDLDRLWEEF
jgi:Uma2 family endonuclease